jgi:hypothetical protein
VSISGRPRARNKDVLAQGLENPVERERKGRKKLWHAELLCVKAVRAILPTIPCWP